MLNIALIIGISLLSGLLISYTMKRIQLPQVIGHLLLGIVFGISGIKLFNTINIQGFNIVAQVALGLIGFMIGGELRWARIKKVGKSILIIAICEATFAFLCVFLVLWGITQHLPFALIVGALASATAPGGTTNVIQEYRARGPLTTTLYGVVGIDDAIAIIIFAIAFNVAKSIMLGNDLIFSHIAFEAGYEIIGSLIFGVLMGFVFVWVMKFIKDDDAKQLLCLGSVLLVTGVALQFDLSLILSNMFLGITISNLKPHPSKTFFQNLYKITPAIYILFFIIVGAKLNIALIPSIGVMGIAYIICRVIGKTFGSSLGAKLSNAPKNVQTYLGLCLLSQAGVALGLAIAAQQDLEAISSNTANTSILLWNQPVGDVFVNMITATTLIFQIVGPILTKYSLEKAGEIKLNVG